MDDEVRGRLAALEAFCALQSMKQEPRGDSAEEFTDSLWGVIKTKFPASTDSMAFEQGFREGCVRLFNLRN